MRIEALELRITNYVLRITYLAPIRGPKCGSRHLNYVLRITSYVLRITYLAPTKSKMRIEALELRITYYVLRITRITYYAFGSYEALELRITYYVLRTTYYVLRITYYVFGSYEVQNTYRDT